MAFSYRYHSGLNTVFIVGEGKPSNEELLEFGRRLASDPEVPPGHAEIVDLREIELPDLSADTLRRLAATFRAHDTTPEQSRVAIVAGNDLAFGLSRMYQAFRGESPLSIRVFRRLDEARAWLGLPDE